MRRRQLLALLAGTGAVLAGARNAPAAPVRIGFVSGGDKAGAERFVAALRDGLAAEGYREPDTLILDLAYADYALDRIPGLVAALEGRGVALTVTHAAATPIVVKGAHHLPVVYEFSADPVASGIAADLAHPLFNATGVTLMRAELNRKRIEFLHQIMPQARRVAIIANPLHPGEPLERTEIAAEAERLGIDIPYFPTPDQKALRQALDAIAKEPPQAILAPSEGFVVTNRKTIIDFAMQHRLPVVSGWAVMAHSGALFTYGPRLSRSYRRTAYFVGRILGGSRPDELPIERPTVFELVINLKTAKQLGLAIPGELLAHADDAIE